MNSSSTCEQQPGRHMGYLIVLIGSAACLSSTGHPTGRPAAPRPAAAGVESKAAPPPPSAGESGAAAEPRASIATESKAKEAEKEPEAAGQDGAIEMTFVGDVMFGRWIPGGYDAIDFQDVDVFGHVRDLLASDLAVANLETPLVRKMPDKSPYGTRLRFAAPPEAAAALRKAGISAVTLANNHSFDMRYIGLRETPEILAEHGITVIGAGRTESPLFRVEAVDIDGWRVGFLAATGVRNGPQRKKAAELPYVHVKQMAATLTPVVRAARPHHDLILVLLHWGTEYKEKPGRRQIRAARALIDAGADAVIAHHAHVLQAIERYKNGLIAYSLGNFLFDNTSNNQGLTGVLRLRYRKSGHCLERAVFHPASVHASPTHHPRPAKKYMLRRVRQRIIDLSADKAFATEWQAEGQDLVLSSPTCPPPGPGKIASP